jgi:ABC-type multidrug transport system fused ATPase/permease subunit
MRLALYIFATFALMAIIAAFTYTVNPDHYTIELMGINFSLPVAVWIVLPMLLLLIFTLVHMFFYGLKNYFILKKWQKDANTLEDALYWSLVNEPKEQKYGIDVVGSSASLLGKASLNISDNMEGLTPRLTRVVNIIQKIKNGDYVDFKEEKMTKVFNVGNPILTQNRLNRLESDDKFVADVLKSTSEYTEIVQAEALETFARKENFVKAQKYAKVFDIKSFFTMLERVTAEDNLELTPEILTDFVKALDLSCQDFIKIVSVTKKYFNPEENLTLFRSYQIENPKAQNAYLYLLFEYELLEQVAIYLNEQEENEFIKFRAFYQLKQENTKYKLEEIIDIDSVCNETRL